ncbi:MAG: diaminopimelate decarboxylase, partial [Clostridia bacterium]|nr:diaminopimelate decarboxylase [Clostridia bacterium]
CHIGSQIFEEKSFLLAADKMISYYCRLKDKMGIVFNSLNLGGGFGVWYANGDREFTPDDYTNMLVLLLSRVKDKCSELNFPVPEVFIEPGRSLVCEAGITVYKVGAVKNIPNLKKYLAIDGGMFENPRFALYQAKYTVKNPLKMFDNGTEIYTIAGKCCESGDIIAEDVKLPEMKKGDYLCVFSTGAYNYSMASNYNRNLIPPVVFVKDGKSYYAVKKQTYEDLVRNDL